MTDIILDDGDRPTFHPEDSHVKHSFSLYFLSFFIALGAFLTWWYVDLAIVRNSILYAGITQAISEHGVLSAVEYARNKPLGFAVVAWPLTEMFGENIGLKLASFMGTSLFCLSVYVFLQRFAKQEINARQPIQLALVIALFNPLIFYQFISGYADTLFAALFLFAVVSLDKALSKDGRMFDALLSVIFTVLAVWVKHHGFVLLPIFMGLALLNHANIRMIWQQNPSQLITLMIGIVVMLLIFSLAQAGKLALFNLGHNVSNFTGGDSRGKILADNLVNFGQWFLISFGLLVPFLLCWRSYSKQYFLLMLLVLFVPPILFYAGARYNMRYFMAITPLFAWIVASQLLTLSIRWRKYWVIGFIVLNSFTILYYNHIGFNEWVSPVVSLTKIDNLRLVSEQGQAQHDLDMIERYAKKYNHTLVYISRYYGSGTFHIWKKMGLFPADLNIHYIKRWKPSLIKKLGLKKVMIYEYFRVNQKKHSFSKDKVNYKKAKRLSKQLYLLDLTTEK